MVFKYKPPGKIVCKERTKVKQRLLTVGKPSVEKSVRKLNSDCWQ